LQARSLRTRFVVGTLLLSACGSPASDARLEVSDGSDGTVTESHWEYRSFEVDVDLVIATEERPGACSTTASLLLNDVVSAAQSYALEPTDCAVLRLTAEGDIVLFERETGHDWSRNDLAVDSDGEVISLGPVTVEDPGSGEVTSYRFTLSAPPCADAPDCDCGVVRRIGGDEPLELALGRECD
jgi:hypothetical protein